MIILLTLSLFVAAIAIVAIVAIRLLLKKKSNELSLRRIVINLCLGVKIT